MNKITIIGNLTNDPQSRTTQDDKTVCNFSVAVNRRQKDKNGNDTADFFRVSAWGNMGANCQKYLKKGKKVAVCGPVSIHLYTANDGSPRGSIEVFAQEVEFLSPVNGNGDASQSTDNAPEPASVDPGELPF